MGRSQVKSDVINARFTGPIVAKVSREMKRDGRRVWTEEAELLINEALTARRKKKTDNAAK